VSRRIVILDGAKEEFRDVRKYVNRKFGDSVWNTVNAEYKDAFKLIKENPQIGSCVDELKEIGITNVKYALVRQTRVVYEFDDNLIIVHIFIGTRRDFRAHLLKRLFSQ
jgi:plasmid stabilization system protein ParE